jgi:4-diphosphocytidyl-2-C-methyl-D-erythritol kinase
MAGGFVKIQAFSKINLILEVLERRTDDYHTIRSVMQSLDLFDTLTIRNETPAGDKPLLHITCDDPALPTDERNLVFRSAKYMMEAYGIEQSISIHIEKRIPVAAGLGGGSSDCAAALVGMNRLLGLNQRVGELREIGLTFGADVPFCVTGGTMLAEGIGEILTELTPHPPCWIVLACLPVPVSTAEVFGKCKAGGTCGQIDQKLSCTHGLYKLKNDLTPITAAMHPEIGQLINQMKRLGAVDASMSGSGPSVFGYFKSETSAHAAEHTLKKTIKSVYITRPERMRII